MNRAATLRNVDRVALVPEVAKAIALDPEDSNSHPRTDVTRWLRGGRYISEERCFRVGQLLGAVNGIEPCGGALSLLAAGHFGESITVLYHLLVSALIDGTPLSDERLDHGGLALPTLRESRTISSAKRDRSESYISDAQETVRYVLRFVGNAFTVLASVDEVEGISLAERGAALRHIGEPPFAALDRAWKRAQHAPLPVNIEFDALAADNDGPHAAALVAWSAFAEMIAQRVGRITSYRETWIAERASLARYLDLAHESMSPLLVEHVSADTLERAKPRKKKRTTTSGARR